MKSHRILLVVFIVLTCTGLNAQLFVGGNLGFSTSGGKIDNGTTTTDKPSSVSFTLAPMAGKFLSDNVAAGISLNLAVFRTSTPGTPQSVNTSTTIGLAPFMRYYALRMDKFSVFGQGNVGFSDVGSKTKAGGVSTDGPTTFQLYLNAAPGLSYDLNEKLSLETTLGIFNFGYDFTSVKSGNTKNRTSSFGFGGGLDNIVTLGDITVGAIYKFK